MTDLVPVVFDAPAPHELMAAPGAAYGGAQVLRRTFLSTLLARNDDIPVFFVTRAGCCDAVKRALRPIDRHGRAMVLAFADAERALAGRSAVLQCLRPNLARAIHFSCTLSGGRWPICGMTHDLFDPDVLLDLRLAATLEAWPITGVACASHAARRALAVQVGMALRGRGSRGICLPVIPHGIDLPPQDKGDDRSADALKAGARRELSIPGGDFVALYLGRLSLSAKADLLALIGAFANARTRRRRTLLLAGSAAATTDIARIRTAIAEQLPGAADTILYVDPSDARKTILLAAADVFVSPSAIGRIEGDVQLSARLSGQARIRARNFTAARMLDRYVRLWRALHVLAKRRTTDPISGFEYSVASVFAGHPSSWVE